MKWSKLFSCTLLTLVICLWGFRADAMIFINEILADPPPGIAGDANGDGVTSNSRDEFIELLNLSDSPINISHWSISDAVKTRHMLPSNVWVEPSAYFVVFGGGIPNLPGINSQTASTGSLGLNNSGDTVTLYNQFGDVVDSISYGREGGKNQSLVRFPEGDPFSSFKLHSEISLLESIYSPGRSLEGELNFNVPKEPFPEEMGEIDPNQATVPELPGYVYFLLSSVALIFLKKDTLGLQLIQ